MSVRHKKCEVCFPDWVAIVSSSALQCESQSDCETRTLGCLGTKFECGGEVKSKVVGADTVKGCSVIESRCIKSYPYPAVSNVFTFLEETDWLREKVKVSTIQIEY